MKKHIRFLNSLINVNKVFKMFILIKKSNESKVFFKEISNSGKSRV